jgi:hypothetical protein
LESILLHPERSAWGEVPNGPAGLVTAADGALDGACALSRAIGVWLVETAH